MKPVETHLVTIPKTRNEVKFEDLIPGSFFLFDSTYCLKLPDGKDDKGTFNCFSFRDKKYYTMKGHQAVTLISRVEVLV